MKYIYIILLVLITLIFLNTCGIEDTTMYFQEPKNISYDDANFMIKFDGYNQEEDGDEYLFVGYDVYYYFNDDSGSAKKAAVRIPKITGTRGTFHSDLIDFRDPNVDSSFQNFTTTELDEIYQDVTFPVTEEMIDDVLEEGNSDNVRLSFENTLLIPNTDDNPKKISGNDYILLEELFPKYEQYKSYMEAGTWGGINDNDNATTFKGFLDQNYYNHYSISLYKNEAGFNYYKMKIFVIAKGFNSNTERNKGDYIESLKSSVKEVTIKVDPATAP